MYKEGTVFRKLNITLPDGEVMKMEVVIDEPKKDKPKNTSCLGYAIAVAMPAAISFIDYLIKTV